MEKRYERVQLTYAESSGSSHIEDGGAMLVKRVE